MMRLRVYDAGNLRVEINDDDPDALPIAAAFDAGRWLEQGRVRFLVSFWFALGLLCGGLVGRFW